MSKSFFRLFLFCLLYLAFPASIVYAEGAALSVSPPVIEALLAPNKTASTTITLKNEGPSTAYTLSLHRLVPTDSFGHSTIDPTPLNQVNTPLEVKVRGRELGTTYPLAESGTDHLTLSLTSASFTEATDFYLALVISLENKDEFELSSSATPGISIPILTTLVPSPAFPTDIAVNTFNPPQIHDSALPLTVSTVLENKGPIMLRVKGNLTLLSPSGKVKQTLDFEPTLILGGNTRSLPNLTFNSKLTDLGPYRLRLTVQTEGGRNLLESEKVVFIAPIRLIIIIVFLLILLSLFFLWKRRLTSPGITS